MVPSLDPLESRQLLSAAPMHVHAEPPSPNPTKSPGLDSFLNGIAAISANDIWSVGLVFTSLGGQATLTEHWDGASWKIINSPNPGNFQDGLSGATALSDGTVPAVGFQRDQGFDATPLILQN
jgi:hypothetical protein